MKITISPNQNTVTITEEDKTQIFEFDTDTTHCHYCDLDEIYCNTTHDFPCLYNGRKDKRNGIFRLKESDNQTNQS